jgi:dTMP kinase
MARWLAQLASRFIVFDGPDGSGKTTQFRRFAEHCRAAGVSVCEVREPGGTVIGEQIRNVLLDPAHDRMSVRCEMMLYMASRAQLIQEKIEPALQRGELVLADRFISSTLAYQGTAGGLTREEILKVGAVAVGHHWPDMTVIFDVDGREASTRISSEKDRMELRGDQFHARVREGFLAQARAEPDRHLLIDASGDADTVFAALLEGLQRHFGPDEAAP